MKKRIILIAFILGLTQILFAQEDDPKKYPEQIKGLWKFHSIMEIDKDEKAIHHPTGKQTDEWLEFSGAAIFVKWYKRISTGKIEEIERGLWKIRDEWVLSVEYRPIEQLAMKNPKLWEIAINTIQDNEILIFNGKTENRYLVYVRCNEDFEPVMKKKK